VSPVDRVRSSAVWRICEAGQLSP